MSKKSKFRLQKHWRVDAAGETIYNVSGTHTIPHGREVTYVEGRGGTGRAAIPSTYHSTNPVIPGNPTGTNVVPGNTEWIPPYYNTEYVPAVPSTPTGLYNPITPGNVKTVQYVNASTPGTYAGTNPSTGGNLIANAYTNPGTGGNYLSTNPDVPGTISGYNTVPGNTNPYVPAQPSTEIYNPGWFVAAGYYPSGSYVGSPGVIISNTAPVTFNPANAGIYPGNATGTYNPYAPASAGNTNPPTTGPANYNPITPGTANYNPFVAGNYVAATYNPIIPGTANYNPVIPGNYVPAYYNPDIPGNENYNPYQPAYNQEVPQPGYTYLNPTTPGNPNYNPNTGANANYNPYYPVIPGEAAVVGNIVLPGSNSPGTVAPYTPAQLVDRYAQDPNYPITIKTSLQGQNSYVIIKNK